MATRPYKTTGCFRFFFFIMIFAPLAYLGASYYNGEDGIGNIKKMASKVVSIFSGVKSSSDNVPESRSTKTNDANNTVTSNTEVLDLKSSIERKDREINTLINENLDLKMKLKECESKSEVKPK